MTEKKHRSLIEEWQAVSDAWGAVCNEVLIVVRPPVERVLNWLTPRVPKMFDRLPQFNAWRFLFGLALFWYFFNVGVLVFHLLK